MTAPEIVRALGALGVTEQQLDRRFPLTVGTCLWCEASGVVRVNTKGANESLCEPCFADGVRMFLAAFPGGLPNYEEVN